MANVEAYSLEIDEFITAERANELHWLGILKDQREFICGNQGCKGKVTCSNMTKPREKMKKRPYFTNVGEHQCTEKKVVGTVEDNEESKSRVKSDTVEFNLNLINYKPTTKGTRRKTHTSDEIEQLKKIRKKGSESISVKSRYGLLMSLVNDFREYQKANILDKKYIEVSDETISFEQMFLNFEEQGINDKTEQKLTARVYHGKGKIQKVSNNSNHYIIYFKSIEGNGRIIKRTAVISQDALNNSTQSIKEALEKLLSEKVKVEWFIYGKPSYKKTDKGTEYLTLYVHKMNAVYFE